METKEIKLYDTDFVLLDIANNQIVTFSDGSAVIFGSYEEAEIDCRGNEKIMRCTDLPTDLKEFLIKELTQRDGN